MTVYHMPRGDVGEYEQLIPKEISGGKLSINGTDWPIMTDLIRPVRYAELGD